MTAHQVGRPAPLFGTLVALALVGALPLAFVLSTAEGSSPSWVGAWLVAGLSGLRFAWLMTIGERRVFEMVFWLFVYTFFGLAPLVQLRNMTDPGTTPGLDHRNDATAIAIVLAGCLAFMAGSWLGRQRHAAAARVPRGISRARLNLLSLGAMALAAFYISRVGFGALLGSRDALSEAQASFGDSTVASVVVAVVNMSTFIAAVGQILTVRHERRVRGTPPYVLAFAMTIVALVCVNPISSARYVVGTIILGILAAIGLNERVRSFRIFSLSAIAGLVFVFPVADYFRHKVASQSASGVISSLSGGDFDAFGQIINTVSYVQASGLTYGRQALGVLFFWLPRSIWETKPVDTGTLVANFRQYDFTNLSAPLWAELFINGGWVALVIGMLLLGVLLRRLDSGSSSRLNAGLSVSVIGAALPFYLLILCRGSLLQAMANLSAMLLCALFIGTRSSSDEPAPISPRSVPSSVGRF